MVRGIVTVAMTEFKLPTVFIALTEPVTAA